VNPIGYTSTATFPQPCLAAISSTQCAAANAFMTAQLGAFPRTQNQDVGFGKIDYAINAANHVSSSFNFINFRAPNSYAPPPRRTTKR